VVRAMDIKAISNLTDTALVQGGSKAENQYNLHSKELSGSVEAGVQKSDLKKELEKLDKEQIENLFKDIKEKFDYMNKYLKIEIDKDLHEPVVKIIDKKTNEVVRQIPPEYLLELAKKIDKLVGLLFSKEV
jgi:flagellar protein FlaG